MNQELESAGYEVRETLQARSSQATYLAKPSSGGDLVIVKALRVGQLKHIKNLELFKRETEVLKKLSHPNIPRFIRQFQRETPMGLTLYLVTECLPGRPLSIWQAEGWRPDMAEIEDMVRQILDILAYLHGHTPPVIHRDLKPANLLRTDKGVISLVDFGAIQELFRPSGGTTVVGTFGYMAPEQFSGQARPASDVYSLGATVVALLSGKSPGDLPRQGLQLDFKSYISAPPRWINWLERCLAPLPQNRFASAAAARDYLDNPEAINVSAPALVQTPLPKIQLWEGGGTRVIKLKRPRYKIMARTLMMYGILPGILPLILALVFLSDGAIGVGSIYLGSFAWIFGYALYKTLYRGWFPQEIHLTPQEIKVIQPSENSIVTGIKEMGRHLLVLGVALISGAFIGLIGESLASFILSFFSITWTELPKYLRSLPGYLGMGGAVIGAVILHPWSDLKGWHQRTFPLRYLSFTLPLGHLRRVSSHKEQGFYRLEIENQAEVLECLKGLPAKETQWLQAQLLDYLVHHQQGSDARNLLLQLKQVKAENQRRWKI